MWISGLGLLELLAFPLMQMIKPETEEVVKAALKHNRNVSISLHSL